MASYRCGPSVLRLEGRTDDPIQPDAVFEFEFPAEQEAALIAGGALTREPPSATPAPNTTAAAEIKSETKQWNG